MVSTDVDEVQNRIVIGVDTEDAVQAAELEIAKLGLPDGAVQVIVAERAVPL